MDIRELVASGGLSSALQPVRHLATGAVVGYEALARGPERPDVLFATAREQGCLAELDVACRATAFRTAAELGVVSPLALFVNVEPEVLDVAPLDELFALADRVPGGLRVVVEITERSLAARPSELLRTVDRIRALGGTIALDDVGADPMSLTFMPLLRPEVVKLDLRLVQGAPGPDAAAIMTAVNAYAERSGALVLAEGIETDAHLALARALGARLGQGYLLGRPGPDRFPDEDGAALVLPPAAAHEAARSPFGALPAGAELGTAPKSLLVEMSKHLEREALRLGRTGLVAATFEDASNFTPATALRYDRLAAELGFVCALGADMSLEPVPGVRGAVLEDGDPTRTEWDVVVLGPHFSAALLARDLEPGSGPDRWFAYALTFHRETVVRAAGSLVRKVAPAPQRLAVR